jgi:hypothetical protein
LNSPIGTLARVQLARAYAAARAQARARGEYEGFFTLWKNGDAEIPLLRAARDEYRRLE